MTIWILQRIHFPPTHALFSFWFSKIPISAQYSVTHSLLFPLSPPSRLVRANGPARRVRTRLSHSPPLLRSAKALHKGDGHAQLQILRRRTARRSLPQGYLGFLSLSLSSQPSISLSNCSANFDLVQFHFLAF